MNFAARTQEDSLVDYADAPDDMVVERKPVAATPPRKEVIPDNRPPPEIR